MEFEKATREQIAQNSADICEEYCLSCFPSPHKSDAEHGAKESLSTDLFRLWVKKHGDTEYVKGQRQAISQMHTELFIEDNGEPLMTHINYSKDLPEDLTKETYI